MKNLKIVACALLFSGAGQVFAVKGDPVEKFFRKQEERQQERQWRVAQAGLAYEAAERASENRARRQLIDVQRGAMGLGIMGLGLMHANGNRSSYNKTSLGIQGSPLSITRNLLKNFGLGGALCAVGSFYAYWGIANFNSKSNDPRLA